MKDTGSQLGITEPIGLQGLRTGAVKWLATVGFEVAILGSSNTGTEAEGQQAGIEGSRPLLLPPLPLKSATVQGSHRWVWGIENEAIPFFTGLGKGTMSGMGWINLSPCPSTSGIWLPMAAVGIAVAK